MAVDEQDSGFPQWALGFFECDPYMHYGYHDHIIQHDANDIYQGQYFSDHDDSEGNHVENDEIIARTLQEEFSQLALEEASEYSHTGDNHVEQSVPYQNWHSLPTRNYNSGIQKSFFYVPLSHLCSSNCKY